MIAVSGFTRAIAAAENTAAAELMRVGRDLKLIICGQIKNPEPAVE